MQIKSITITRSLIVSIAVILIILLLPLFVRQSRSELEKTIITCESAYSSSWKLSSVTQDDSSRKIIIRFRLHNGDLQMQMESMQRTYEEITKVLFEQKDSKYTDYTINFSFETIQQKFLLMNVNRSLNQVQIHTDMEISVRGIASFFPQVSELYLYPAYYENINEIKNFRSISKVHFSQGLTPSERQDILLAFPNCVISD